MTDIDVAGLGKFDTAIYAAFMTPEGQADPYPHYAVVRESASVHEVFGGGPFVLTRYDDCLKALHDPRFGQGEQGGPKPHELFGMDEREFNARFPRWRELPESLLGLNPPDHTRIRGLVSKAFTPKTIEALRPKIVELADDLLDRMDGTTDVMAAFAVKLPMGMIGDLLGVPRDDLDGLQPHVRIAIGNLDVRAPSLEQFSAAYDAGHIVQDYFRELIGLRHTDPGDDLLSQLLHSETAGHPHPGTAGYPHPDTAGHPHPGSEGDRLTEPELIALVLLLFGAGFETTTNLIGNGLRALLLQPDQLRLLRNDRSLLPSAVEEMLRWDSPVQVTARGALEDAELFGHRFERGTSVMAILGAACRDPRKYDDPDRFDITRQGVAQPMSFGGGIHYCLGAPLARLEGQVAFDRLLARFRVIEPAWSATEPLRYRDSTILRGLEALPVDLLA